MQSFILPLFLLFLCQVSFASEPVRVLTFNILASEPSWEVNAKQKTWDLRLPVVLDVMLKYPDGNGPYDFIGTQETSQHDKPELHQIRQLEEKMEGYDSLHAPCTGKDSGFSLSNMIFWKSDRWEIDPDDSGTFWLSSTPEAPGSNDWVENNRGGQRCVTYGLFHEKGPDGRTGRKVYFYNTHLNVHVPEARVRSAFLILEKIRNRKEKDAAVVLAGDFNSRRTTAPYLYLTGNAVGFDGRTHTPPLRLRESFDVLYPDSDEKPPIDFIFVDDKWKPVSAKRIPTKKDGVQPSDHPPIEAVLEF